MAGREKGNGQHADERRDEVAHATWRVIAREGLDRASLRAIAQEMGSTTGVLTHYFRDKEALLDFAFEAIVEKLQFASQAGRKPPEDLAAIKALLNIYLPITVEGLTWWRVWLSFTVAALASDRQGESNARLYKELRRFWTKTLSHLSAQGLVRKDLEPALEAETLLALIDGIGVHALISPKTMTAARQLEIVERHLVKLAAV